MQYKYFCTYFNKNYLAHGRSLYESLISVMPNAKLLMMCMDDESFEVLSQVNYPHAILAKYSDMESQNPALLIAKENRSLVEYFYTCSSATCVYSMKNIVGIDSITYLDADLFFFSSPQAIFDEMRTSSIGIIEHKFSKLTMRNKIYGLYNVGWITFRNDQEGNKCINDWHEKCLEWCYQKLEGDKYADQKYLDKWPQDYKNVCIIQNIGANLAIWNINNYKLNKIDDQVYVDNQKLIFYHFANFKQIGKNVFKTDLSRVFYKTNGIVKHDIYMPYIKKIIKNQNSDYQIIAKKDLHAKGIKLKLIHAARKIREILYKDLIQMNEM